MSLAPPRYGQLPARRRWVLSYAGVAEILFAIVCLTAGNLLIKLGVQSLAWLFVYGCTVFWCLRKFRETLTGMRRYWIVFLPPAFAILSTVWSIVPGQTLWSSFQFLMTSLIAFRLGLTLAADRALFILAGIFAAAIILSLANTVVGFLPPAWEHNGALLGIFTQKNMMGKAAVLGILTAICVLKHKRIPLIGLGVYLAGFFIVKSTLSAGALMTFLCVGLLFPLFAMRRFSVRGRLIFLLLPVVFLILYMAAFVLTGGDPLAVFLEATGKSPTLTGRTIIWWFGIQSFLEHPLLGVGFKAYWSVDSYAIAFIHANIEEGLYWFHNIYIDILVAGGLLGAAVAVALLYCFVRQALRWYLQDGSVVSAGWGMILLVSMIAGLADNVMFTLHGLNHMLIIMGFIFGHRALNARQATSRAPAFVSRRG